MSNHRGSNPKPRRQQTVEGIGRTRSISCGIGTVLRIAIAVQTSAVGQGRFAQAHLFACRKHDRAHRCPHFRQTPSRRPRLTRCTAFGGQIKNAVALSLPDRLDGGIEGGHGFSDSGRCLHKEPLTAMDGVKDRHGKVILTGAKLSVRKGCRANGRQPPCLAIDSQCRPTGKLRKNIVKRLAQSVEGISAHHMAAHITVNVVVGQLGIDIRQLCGRCIEISMTEQLRGIRRLA